MLDAHPSCKCIEHEDKKLILKIIEEAIRRESEELANIEAKRMRGFLKPPFVESFIGIRSSLVKVRKEFKQDMTDLKKRVEEYPKCMSVSQHPITGKSIEKHPTYEDTPIPVPYSQRKL